MSTIKVYATFRNIPWTSRRIMVATNSSVYLFDLDTGKELLRWVAFDNENWVVTHTTGLFDASPGALDKLYFVSGLEILGLNPRMSMDYEPGLWKKVMGRKTKRSDALESVRRFIVY